jgi:ABC-2 type transport system permease protein
VLLATMKSGGIILIAPAVIQLVPSIPQWIAHLFPTFYILDPVLQISQKGAGLGDIIGDVSILLAIIAVLLIALASVIERQQKRMALAG